MKISAALITLLVSGPCLAQGWTSLFNGRDLQGWDTWLGPRYDTVAREFRGEPTGLNKDPNKVFSVVNIDGSPALRISGEHFGGISTRQVFGNYHLQLEFKWGRDRHAPRANNKRDSGVLYHATGRHGADYGFWMCSQEFQVQEGDCGDYWGVAGGSFDISVTGDQPDRYVYNPSGMIRTFNEKSANGRHCIKNPDAERPTGEWNVIDIYCVGDTAVHIMNGTRVMELVRSARFVNDKLEPLKEGMIQLQSEGAEIFYRNIRMREIQSLPAR